MTRYDVVIVGGGVIGSAIAHFLAQDPDFGGTVAVVERDPTYRTASSALSASSIRQQFSTAVNIAISRFGISFLRDIGRHLAVDGQAPEIGLREPGYLYLASPEGLPVLEENHRIQRAEDVKVALLNPDELVARFPWISNDGIAAASLGLEGEGWFDGYSVMQAFRAKARSLGVAYIHGEAVGMERQGSRIEAVTLKDGTRLACGHVVNAGGPHARSVAGMAGIALPVEARRRSNWPIARWSSISPASGFGRRASSSSPAWRRPSMRTPSASSSKSTIICSTM
jgi:glycine/D-amino acid oxidase-like deaminating enzyme